MILICLLKPKLKQILISRHLHMALSNFNLSPLPMRFHYDLDFLLRKQSSFVSLKPIFPHFDFHLVKVVNNSFAP